MAVALGDRLAHLPIACGEAHVVAYLGSYAPCPVGDLNRVFGHKASTVTSMLDRLEEAGLLERHPNPDDRRSYVVTLTAQGERLARDIRKVTEDLEREIARHATAADRKGFENVMKAIETVTLTPPKERTK